LPKVHILSGGSISRSGRTFVSCSLNTLRVQVEDPGTLSLCEQHLTVDVSFKFILKSVLMFCFKDYLLFLDINNIQDLVLRYAKE